MELMMNTNIFECNIQSSPEYLSPLVKKHLKCPHFKTLSSIVLGQLGFTQESGTTSVFQ